VISPSTCNRSAFSRGTFCFVWGRNWVLLYRHSWQELEESLRETQKCLFVPIFISFQILNYLNDFYDIWEENYTRERQQNANHLIPIINKKIQSKPKALFFRNVKFCMEIMLRKIFIRNINKFRIYNWNINLCLEFAENSVIIKKLPVTVAGNFKQLTIRL
jgi:hypothetical protein